MTKTSLPFGGLVLRGNLLQKNYVKSNNKSSVVRAYIYDEMNKMVQGKNEAGEISLYTYISLPKSHKRFVGRLVQGFPKSLIW